MALVAFRRSCAALRTAHRGSGLQTSSAALDVRSFDINDYDATGAGPIASSTPCHRALDVKSGTIAIPQAWLATPTLDAQPELSPRAVWPAKMLQRGIGGDPLTPPGKLGTAYATLRTKRRQAQVTPLAAQHDLSADLYGEDFHSAEILP